MRTHDYLEMPQEKQATPADASFSLQLSLNSMYRDILQELKKNNPDVLTTTVIAGGSPVIENQSNRIWFEIGGKPVKVYKIMCWMNVLRGSSASVSIEGLSSFYDGISIPGANTPLIMNVAVDSLYLRTDTSAALGLNVPYSANSDGVIYLYGWTISEPEKGIY